MGFEALHGEVYVVCGITSCVCSLGNYHGVDFQLQALNTFGNCHRPVFSLGVSQHMHKVTSL